MSRMHWDLICQTTSKGGLGTATLITVINVNASPIHIQQLSGQINKRRHNSALASAFLSVEHVEVASKSNQTTEQLNRWLTSFSLSFVITMGVFVSAPCRDR